MPSLRRRSRLALLVAAPTVAALALGGCSNDKGLSLGGHGGGGSTAPSLSNLAVLPLSAAVNDGAGSVSVSFGVDVYDPDADVARIVATIRDASGVQVNQFNGPVSNPPGATHGQLTGNFPVPTTVVATYTLEFQAFDSGGRGSNTVQATFPVVQGNPLPAIASLTPASAPAGAPGFDLTVTGSNFVASSVVRWSGYDLPTTYVDATTLHAQVATWQIPYASTIAVTVYTPPPGGGLSSPASFTVTPPPPRPVPVISSLSPSSVDAGDPTFTLTVTGSDFTSASWVTWNGSSISTTFVDASTLTATVWSWQVATAGTATVAVFTPAPGGGTSSGLTFTINPTPTRPVPTLTSISPSTADAGTSSVTITATGTGFVRSSVVRWNSYDLTTTYVSDTSVQATVPSYLLSSVGVASVTVFNPTPGGGLSGPMVFTVTIPPQPGLTAVSLPASDLAWDPYHRKIYASLASTSPVSPNCVVAIDPFTGQLGEPVYAGSEPGRLSVSDDGQFLYVALGGASSVRRFALPALVTDLDIPLGSDPTYGPYTARDVAAAPGAGSTIAVTLRASGNSYAGGLAVFDDATPRSTRFTNAYVDAVGWGSSASTLYASSSSYYGDLLVLSVDASGVVLTKDWGDLLGSPTWFHFDPGTGLVYTDGGRAVSPADGSLAGTYSLSGLYSPVIMTPDSSLESAFFAGSNYSITELRAYDLTRFVPLRTLDLSYVYGLGTRLVRWGPDGLAFVAGKAVILERGPFVLPVSDTPNPTPVASSLSPSSASAGSGNFRLTVTGTGFVPGSLVSWDGAERSTTFVSPTQLVAFIPASDVAAAGTPQVTVTSPAPGGGASGAVTFTVN